MENRRVRMTKRMLKEAYTELLCEDPSRRVTVSELCERADVNRSSFYSHYRNVEELRDEMQEEFISSMPLRPDISVCPDEGGEFAELVKSFLDYVAANAAFYRIATTMSGAEQFRKKMTDIVYDCYGAVSGVSDPIVARYACAFSVGGVIDVISEWIADGCRMSTTDLASLILHMTVQAHWLD